MLCVTGFETTAAAWRARVAAHPEYLHELRLDAMDEPAQALAQLDPLPAGTLACCRPLRQGGRYHGPESTRLTWLARAERQGAQWIDVEADVPDEHLCGWPRERVLLSWHEPERADADTVTAALARLRGRSGAFKLAVTVSDVVELAALLAVQPDQPAVLLAMGPAGLLSRCCYPAFGSAWSYVAASAEQATATGQLSLRQAERWGLPAAARQPLFALLGGEQVLRSPGPDVYNPLLRQLGVAGLYLPLLTRQLAPALALLRRLGLVAASVTMPLKRAALTHSQPDALAAEVGAVNSLAWRHGAWHGSNTDVAGVRLPLERAIAGLAAAPRQALILGAGGAAAAASIATRQLGLHTTVAARNSGAARALGPDAAVAWSERGEVPHQLLINATPCSDTSPWPSERPWQAELVFDMTLGAPSALLSEARKAGAASLTGLDMWLAQGAAQLGWMLAKDIREELLRAHLGPVEPPSAEDAA